MRYWSRYDRKISAYSAILIITLVAAGAGTLIVNKIAGVDWSALSARSYQSGRGV
jgi:hypothetical protein